MRLVSLTIFSKLYLGSDLPNLNFPQNFLLSRSHQVITLDYLYIYSSFLFAGMLLQFTNEPCRQGRRHRGNRGNASPIFGLSNICRKLIVHFNVVLLRKLKKILFVGKLGSSEVHVSANGGCALHQQLSLGLLLLVGCHRWQIASA